MSVKYTISLETLQAGEVTPLLRGRVDTNQNSQGCRTLQNFIPIIQGGATRREGTRLVFPTLANGTTASRLIPFVVDDDTSYMIEFGDEVLRAFFTDSGGNSELVGGAGTSPSDVANQEFETDISDWTFTDTSQGGSSMSVAWNAAQSGCARFSGTFSSPETATGTFEQAVLLPAGTYRIHTRDFETTAYAGVYNILVRNTAMDQVFFASNSTDVTVPDPDYYEQVILPADTYTFYLTPGMPTTSTMDINSIVVEKVTSEGVSPYPEEDLDDIDIQQIGDGNGLAIHPNYPPKIFNILDFDFSNYNLTRGPFFDINHTLYGGEGTGTTLTTAGGAVGANITVTSSVALFASTDSNDGTGKGRLIRIRPDSASAWGSGEITTFTSSTQVTVTVLETIANTTTSTEWRLGSWSDTTGWPRATAIHEQRLIFGGTTAQPQTIWGSYAGDYTNFAPDDGSAEENITDLTAFAFTLDTRTTETIQWLLSRESLMIGTDTQIHIARATNQNEALTPRNVVIRPAVGVGCAYTNPIVAQDDILFIHRYAKQLMQIEYNFDTDRQEAINLSVLAEHITDQNSMLFGAVQNYPYRLIWTGLVDGQLASITQSSQSKMTAWARHILGGNFSDGNPIIRSLATKPGINQDEMWAVVKRTIDGGTFYTIELLGRSFTSSATRTDGTFLDASVEFVIDTGVLDPVNVNITDLAHLEGETVTITRNGALVGMDTITAGELTTTDVSGWDDGDVVFVGLPFTSILETNNLEAKPNHGTIQGLDQRIHETTLRLHNSLGGKIGYLDSNLYNIGYPSTIDPSDMDSEMFSGDISLKFPQGWNRDARVRIVCEDPYPFTLTLLVNKIVYGTG